jgi:MFS family permease
LLSRRRRLAADSPLWIFLLAIFPVVLVFFQHQSSMALFLVRDLQLSELQYGLLFTINTLMIIVLEIPLTSVIAHWSYRKSLGIGAALFGVGFGALAVARTIPEIAFTVVLWTVGEMVLFPAMSAYIAEISPDNRKGKYMGLFTMTFSAGFMLGPWAGTRVLERYGAQTLWLGTLAFGAASALLLARLPAKHVSKT